MHPNCCKFEIGINLCIIFKMDLKTQYNAFWASRDLNAFIALAQKSYTNIGFNSSMIQPEYLLRYFFENTNQTVSYEQWIPPSYLTYEYLINFWAKQHNDAVIAEAALYADNISYQNTVAQLDQINSILKGVANVFSFLTKPVVLFAILGVVLYRTFSTN